MRSEEDAFFPPEKIFFFSGFYTPTDMVWYDLGS